MKKNYILALCLFGFTFLPCHANCDCTSSEIVSKLNNASSYDLKSLFDKLIDSADFSPSYTTTSAFAQIIYEARNDYNFKNALKSYIEHNCSIQNNKIICR